MFQQGCLGGMALVAVCLTGSVHAAGTDDVAAAPPARAELTIYAVSKWPRQFHVMPGEWLLLSSRQALWTPHLFAGQTTLTFVRHDGCRFFLLSPRGEEQLVGVRVGSATGRSEARAAIRAGVGPLTIWCHAEGLQDIPPLPSGRHYALSVDGLTSLAPLAKFRAATALKLSCTSEVTDLSPLAAFTRLESLWLSCPSASDLRALGSLARLKVLHLRCGRSLADLSPLSGLRSLQSLTVDGAEALANLGPLASLSRLSVLALPGCSSLTDLSPLTGLSRLTWLDLQGCRKVADLAPLKSLSHLATLELSDCPEITDLSPLADLAALSSVRLRNAAEVTDLAPLARLTRLKGVDLLGCRRVADLSPLQEAASEHPRTIRVDPRLRDQLETLEATSPFKVTIVMNGRHVVSAGMPPESPGELGGWVNIVGRTISPSLVSRTETERLLYPVWRHEKGSVLDFEWRSYRVTLSVGKGPRRLVGIVATTPEGLAALGYAIAEGVSPLIIWADAESLDSLPPLPAGRDYTLVVLGMGVPLDSLSSVRNLSGLHAQYSSTTTSSLYPLRRLTSLKSLTLVGSPELTSLARLGEMAELASLCVSLSPDIDDLRPLARLTRLRTLQLACPTAIDLSPLAQLPALRELAVEAGPEWFDLSSLRKLTGLETLSLRRTGRAFSIRQLGNLASLKALHLTDCKHLTLLIGLGDLRNLEAMTVQGCDRFWDISPLASLPKLRWLDLDRCPSITDAATLQALERRGVTLTLDRRLEDLLAGAAGSTPQATTLAAERPPQRGSITYQSR